MTSRRAPIAKSAISDMTTLIHPLDPTELLRLMNYHHAQASQHIAKADAARKALWRMTLPTKETR